MNKRQQVMLEEPHESYASFLQGMYGSPPLYNPMKATSSLKPRTMATPPWPGLTMDNIPILDPKPVFDKTFMENFLSSNNKHFHPDSNSGSDSSSDGSNQAYDDDNDSENEESQHHSQRLSKPQATSTSGRLRSFKSFMPFGFGNFFGGSPESKAPGRSHQGSRSNNPDEFMDDDEDSSSHHDSCDSHESSDSKRHVKFASPEIEIVTPLLKTTPIPVPTESSTPPTTYQITTKSPDSQYDTKNNTDITNAM